MKKIICIAGILLATMGTYAQESKVKGFVDNKKTFKKDTTKGWKKGGYFALNANTVGLNNWAAGGQQSISLSALADMFAIYKKGKNIWENYAKLGYGVIKLTDDSTGFQKNEDNLFFISKYGYQIGKKWNAAALVQLESQMFPGFDPNNLEGSLISNFFAPAMGLISAGFDYRPKKHLSFYLSPVTGKITVVADQRLADMGLYGVEPGKQIRTELGWYVKMMFQKDVMKNTNLQSRLDLFTNYEYLGRTDVSWENTVNMKVNKYISASVFTNLKYDHDIDTKPDNASDASSIGVQRNLQFKYVLGVGLAYKIGDTL